MNITIRLSFALFFIQTLYPSYSQLIINEVCINNSSIISDYEHKYEDWIELYNSSSTSINLTNYSITDNPTNPQKWVFPEVNMSPGSYLIIWASDKNLKRLPDTLHTNFKLSASEMLAIYDSDMRLLDSKQVPLTKLDHSYGRISDAASAWGFISLPSPNSANISSHSFSDYNRDSIRFSQKAGFYTGSQTIHLSGGAEIRYTTDGSEPTKSSTLYISPIIINNTTVIKAAKYDNGTMPLYTWVATYFINENTKLPVFSLSTNPEYFFDYITGIYVKGPNAGTSEPYFGANFWQDWERPIYVEFFDKRKQNPWSQLAGVRIHGNYSRSNDQKSLVLMAKSKYGLDRIRYKFYEEKNIDTFEDVILRNSGTECNITHFRDGFLHKTIGQFTGLDYQAYQPSVVFLNGNYWGIQNIREKISADYISENHGIAKEDVDLAETWGDAIEGSNNIWDLEWRAKNLNMTNQATFKQVADSFDLDNLVDYIASEVYVGNWDWGNNNIKFWRNRAVDRKYKMILWDLDISLGLYGLSKVDGNNLDSIYNYKRGSLSPVISIFKSFTNNLAFRHKFINRYADLMNSLFVPEKFKAKAYAFRDSIAAEMPRHHAKWPPYDTWENHIKHMTDYIEERPTHARNHLQNTFNLPKQINLTLEVAPQGAGYIKINSIFTDETSWTGVYYEGVPVQITSIANPGFTFEYWDSPIINPNTKTSKTLTLNITANEKITAQFSGSKQDLKFTLSEINFYSKSTADAGDWIELHNFGNSSLDISFWSIKDMRDYHKFSFPLNTILLPDQRIILCSDSTKFKSIFGSTNRISGKIDFGLQNQGDEIRIYNHKNELYQRIKYEYTGIWDNRAFGQGYTLELKDSQLDPMSPSSWSSGCERGTPFTEYTSNCSVNISDHTLDNSIVIIPNPTEDNFSIHLNDNSVQTTHFTLYNMQGHTLLEMQEIDGQRLVDISSMPAGIYHLCIYLKSGKTITKKVLKY